MHQIKMDKLKMQFAFNGQPDKDANFKRIVAFVNDTCRHQKLPAHTTHKKCERAPWSYGTVELAKGSRLRVGFGWVRAGYRATFECNATKGGYELLSDCLRECFVDGPAAFLQQGRLTYIELAVDFEGVAFEDLLFIDTRLRKSLASYQSAGSIYLGSRTGNRSIICYSKNKQMKDVEGVDLGYELLRIEARLRPPTELLVNEVPACANPLASLIVVDKTSLESCKTALGTFRKYMADGFFSQIAYRRAASISDRSKLDANLRELAPSWWNPSQIWATAPAALEWTKKILH